MKVLIATTESQGFDSEDFIRAVPGELVVDMGPCQDATATDDWSCACSRSFVGVSSGQLTTTAKVVEGVTVVRDDYTDLVRDSIGRWCCPECAREIAHLTLTIAGQWSAGTVLERSRSTIRAREPHAPA